MKKIYESRKTPPISTHKFILRMLGHAFLTLFLIAVSLAMGMAGYVYYEHMSLIDAFLNTAMLLGGMGPVKTDGLSHGGKIFAGFYALYAGLVFIAALGIMLVPIIHRVLHRFHWDDERK
jgi:hypothetical protein